MELRLALYSDQQPPSTDPIDEVVRGWLPASGGRIGYLPSSPDRERAWFRPIEAYYGRYGLSLHFFGLEDEFDPSRMGDLFACHAIHLTGGNTFRFLYWLRVRGLMDDLCRYAAEGGVLVGISAGAILMTPDIGSSSLCGDAPYPGLESTVGLGLVDFAVVPHFDGSAEADLAAYSKEFAGAVYTIPDGGAVLVEGAEVTAMGGARKATGRS